MKDALICIERVGIQDRVYRSIHFVLQGKAVPTRFAVGVFGYPGIESPHDVTVFVCTRRATNGSFQIHGKMMTFQTLRRLAKVGRQKFDQRIEKVAPSKQQEIPQRI